MARARAATAIPHHLPQWGTMTDTPPSREPSRAPTPDGPAADGRGQGERSGRPHGDGSQGRPRGRRRGRGRRDSGRRHAGNASRAPRREAPRGFTPEQVEQRRATIPQITYPEQLPVSARREEIAEAIRDHQVVIVAGETGSGKTTQLPKICLELGRGVEGMIGHTQPRRIAARTVAERIAHELGVDLGGAVGYQVRFTDQVSATTLVKLMTDGILLAEIQRDPMLRRYDTIIIDEAHERSLNIDFLLGYLHTLLPLRPDLKLIITSATIDSARFARHYGRPKLDVAGKPLRDEGGEPLVDPAPIVEVTGRTYPVEIRYRPLAPDVGRDGEEDGPEEGFEDFDAAGNLHVEDTAREEAVDQVTGIIEACDELMAEGPGDILVFLAGEADIRDTHIGLQEHLGRRYLAPGATPARVPGEVEVVPLYARLSSAEQHRVFEAHSTRRIVLATNVAETSLTVPGIRYVVDPGNARISRFSNKTKVQRLPIEPVSQASANQRSGRSGRVADGIAIRLYSRRDFESRPRYTDPEILRTSLASVILQMAALGLGDVARFPFVDPPEKRAVRDGVQLLTEIGALETEDARRGKGARSRPRRAEDGEHDGPRLTRIGRELARLPIDPRLGRMLLEAQKNGCAAEVLVIVAALSVQDVRERPTEKRQQADEYHRRFTDPTSDFLAYLNLWRYLRAQQRDLSGSAFRRLCKGEFLNYLRVREWQDVVAQLRQLANPLGLTMRPIAVPPARDVAGASPAEVADAARAVGASHDTPSADAIHQSLLVGLLSNLGTYDERKKDYGGARGTRFVIWPGSGLSRRTPNWVMAAELVETSRLFARTVAKIDVNWVEPLAQHLTTTVYGEPYWSTRHGATMTTQKVMLYGMTLVADRIVPLTRVGTDEARETAREMFIRHGLVEGDWRTHHQFLRDNVERVEEAEAIAARARQYGLVADEEARARFFEARVPASITSGRAFDRWWKDERRRDPDLLTYPMDILLPHGSGAEEGDYPDTWTQGDLTLPLVYEFKPGLGGDGVTCIVPVSVLARVRPAGFDWMVPGMADELAVATIKGLPKRVRRELVPAPDVARQIVPMLPPWEEVGGTAQRRPDAPSYREAFAAAARDLRGVIIDDDAWAEATLPAHLTMNFRVTSERGAVLDEGTDLPRLQRELAPQAANAVRSVVRGALALAMDEAERTSGGRGGTRGPGTGGRAGASGGAAVAGGATSRGAVEDALPGGPAGAALPSVPGSTPVREQRDVRGWPSLESPDGTGGTNSSGGLSRDVIPVDVETVGPQGLVVRGYPALVEERVKTKGKPAHVEVALRILADPTTQVLAHRSGVRRLVLEAVRLAPARITSRWTGAQALALAASPYANTDALVEDVQLAAVTTLVDRWASANLPGKDAGALRSRAHFDALVAEVRGTVEDEVYRIAGIVVETLQEHVALDRLIKDATSMALMGVLTDVKDQVSDLVFPGFVGAIPLDHLQHLPRYLRAAQRRIDKARSDVRPDDAGAYRVHEVEDAWTDAAERWQTDVLGRTGAASLKAPPVFDSAVVSITSLPRSAQDAQRAAALVEARWLLEELRVSVFAQQLGTPVKVSEKRILKVLAGA